MEEYLKKKNQTKKRISVVESSVDEETYIWYWGVTKMFVNAGFCKLAFHLNVELIY